MKTYTVTYNVTLTIEAQADSADEAEQRADRELPRIATSIAPWFAIASQRQPRGRHEFVPR